MKNSVEELYGVLSHSKFLSMKGLANEVPIFIKTYNPKDEIEMEKTIDALVSRLKSTGISVVLADLFDLVIDILQDDGRMERIIEIEAKTDKCKVLEMLKNCSDPKKNLIPKLSKFISKPDVKLTLIKGIGKVYPFLRTHTILENLQPEMMPHPVVIFFPGEYTYDEEFGSQLRLFGDIADHPQNSKLKKSYYRAFNLDQYKV